MPFDFLSADYVPSPCVGPGLLVLCALAVLVIGAASGIVLMIRRAQQLVRIQAREHARLHAQAEQPLCAGPGHVVAGRVELDRGEQMGVRVDVLQQVKNHTSKSSRWHTWAEISRSVVAVPFYLVREGGQSVYVEPDQSVLVVDTLETKYPDESPNHRLRIADVRTGEEFFAYGDLYEAPHPRALDAYRGGVGWVLRAPKRGRMLLATEGIRDRYTARIRFLRVSGAILGALFCTLHALFTLPFAVACVLGTHATTDVTKTSSWVTHGKHNQTTTHYALDTRTRDGFALHQEVPYEVYAAARAVEARGGKAVVPIVRTYDWPAASFVGPDPYIAAPWLIAGLIGGALTFFLIVPAYRAKYAWYDQKKLTEHGGSGHWQEPRPYAPVSPGTN